MQQLLVEAAKLSPPYSYELVLVYERERHQGNKNRATLAVATKAAQTCREALRSLPSAACLSTVASPRSMRV
jgi:hypothetical protein